MNYDDIRGHTHTFVVWDEAAFLDPIKIVNTLREMWYPHAGFDRGKIDNVMPLGRKSDLPKEMFEMEE